MQLRATRLTAIAHAVRKLFSPRSLFASGAPGVWYDPSDFSTLFQDSAGTTPVTAVEQPVGLMLDKSGYGNHAFQATSASRPVLSARYNLLTKTEDFSDAAWARSAGVSAPTTYTGTTPLGTIGTIYRFTFPSAAAAALNIIYQNTTSPQSIAAGQKFGLWAKQVSGGDKLGISMQTAGGSPTSGTFISGVKTVSADWSRIDIQGTFPSPSGNVGVTVGFDGRIAEQRNLATITVDIWGADLRVANNGITQPAYQRVNTATDYNTTGFLPYLRFDGVDDSLSTNSISFTSTDKMSVFAGVRKLSAAVGLIAELSANADTNPGVFNVANDATASNQWFSKAVASAVGDGYQATASPYASPVSSVLASLFNLSGATLADKATIRVNGVASSERAQVTAGTGNYGNYPLYIGRRGGATLPFNGQMYSLIVVGKAVTAGELSSTETYVNQKTGAY